MPDLSDNEMASEPHGDVAMFADKLAASVHFQRLFRDGMALITNASTYLDGQGRVDSRRLPASQALAYATESMRLTTRLMQLASWLLLMRAVNENELSAEQAKADRSRVDLTLLAPFANDAVLATLPSPLVDLIHESFQLASKIRTMDTALQGKGETLPAAADSLFETYRNDIRRAFDIKS